MIVIKAEIAIPRSGRIRASKWLSAKKIQQVSPVCYLSRRHRVTTNTIRLHRLSGYILVVLLSVTLLLGGLFSKFVVNHAWTATRFIVYGLGPMSIAGGVLSRARYFFLTLSFRYKFWTDGNVPIGAISWACDVST